MSPVITQLPILILYPHSRCNCRCVMCDIWKTSESREISAADLERHAADATEDLRARPELVVRPRSEEEVRALLAAAKELKFTVTPQGALTGLSGGALTVSSIYIWYEADFGGTEAGVIEHLKRYARPALTSALAAIDHISGDSYDWALNDLRQ